MNHQIFLHENNNNTWYYDGYDDFDRNWRIGFEMFYLKQGKRLSYLKDFTHKIEHFVQGLDMLSTDRLLYTELYHYCYITTMIFGA